MLTHGLIVSVFVNSSGPGRMWIDMERGLLIIAMCLGVLDAEASFGGRVYVDQFNRFVWVSRTTGTHVFTTLDKLDQYLWGY